MNTWGQGDKVSVDAIRKIAAAASPGPWSIEWDWSDVDGETEKWAHALVGPSNPHGAAPPTDFSDMRTADLEFIVAAREVVPVLLAEVDRLTEALQSIAYEGGDCLAVEGGTIRLDLTDGDYEPCGVCAVCWAREALNGGAA